jgi:hypothetical protein
MMNGLNERGDHGMIPAKPPVVEATDGVIFVDLDGTLIQTDLLHESLLLLSKQSIGMLLRAMLRLGHGRADRLFRQEQERFVE